MSALVTVPDRSCRIALKHFGEKREILIPVSPPLPLKLPTSKLFCSERAEACLRRGRSTVLSVSWPIEGLEAQHDADAKHAAGTATRAHVADAIAKVREAMVLAGEQEISHALQADEPCGETHAAEDAAVRDALLTSEDAKISILETLPPLSGTFGN